MFYIAYTKMLVSKKPRRPNANCYGPNTNHHRSNASPHLSWWNIIRIGYTRAWLALGILISWCLSFVLGTQRKRGFWWNTSLSVCQVARATREPKSGMSRSKLRKEVTEIKVYWFVRLNTFKIAKSKNGLFVTYTCNHVGFSSFPLLIS